MIPAIPFAQVHGKKKPVFTKPKCADDVFKILADDSVWGKRKISAFFTNPVWIASAAEYQGFHFWTETIFKFYSAYSAGKYFKIIQRLTWLFSHLGTLEKAGLLLEGIGEKENN